MIPISVYLFLLVELVAVSYGDLKTKKIPNVWSLLNIATLGLLLIILPEYYAFHWKILFYSLVFLLVGFGLFLLRVMGGGDSKFLFSFYLLVPVRCQEMALLYLLYSTIIVGSTLFLTVTINNFSKIRQLVSIGRVRDLKNIYGSKFSFAPVILMAWIWMGWEIGIFRMK